MLSSSCIGQPSRVATERNVDLRDMYHCNLSEFRSYHFVYIDESDVISGLDSDVLPPLA